MQFVINKKMDPNMINEIIGGSESEEIRAQKLRDYFDKYSETDRIVGSNFVSQHRNIQFKDGYMIKNTTDLDDYVIYKTTYTKINKIIKNRLKVITPTFYHILKDYGFDIGLCSIRIVEYILRHVIKYCNNEIYFLFKNDCQVKKGYNDSFLSTYSNFEYICRYGNVELLDYILKDYLRGFKKTREFRTEEEQKKLELKIYGGFGSACRGLWKNKSCIDCLMILVDTMMQYEMEANKSIWFSAIISRNVNVINLVTTLKFDYDLKFTFSYIEYYDEDDFGESNFVNGNVLAYAMFNSSCEVFKYILYNVPAFDPRVICSYNLIEGCSLLDLAKWMKFEEKYKILLEFFENKEDK